MINGAQFDFTSGPDMKGSWENVRTGEVINIKDTIIEDNQIVGITTDGRQIPFSKLQNYVKSDIQKPTSGPTRGPMMTKPKRVPQKEFIDDVDKEVLGVSGGFRDDPQQSTPEDYSDQLRQPLPPRQRPTAEPKPESPATPSPVMTVLDGLKKSEVPKIDIHIKWGEIPEGILFLKKYLGLSEDVITKAVISKFVNLKDIQESLSKEIEELIWNGLNSDKKKDKKDTKKSGS